MSRYSIYGSQDNKKYYIEIIDKETDKIYTENYNNVVDLLNQQDEKIKELEEATVNNILSIIDDLFNCYGWIEDIKFDEFKSKVLKEYSKRKGVNK